MLRTISALLLFVLMSVVPGRAYISKFIDIAADSKEAQFLQNPSQFPLAEAGLIASGIYTEDNLLKLNNIIAESKKITDPDKRALAKKIFEFMHKTILKKYVADATTLENVLKNSQYNCVSSTLIYNILLEPQGITAKAVVLPSQEHVFSILSFNTQVEVETTSPYGFDAANNPEIQANLKKLTGAVYSSQAKDRIEVDNIGLLAFLYVNRAYFASQKKDNYNAFQYMLKAAAIYPNSAIIATNTASAFVNYSAELIDKKDFAKAMAILEEAMDKLSVDKTKIINNYRAALDGYISQLVDAKKYDDAFAALKKAETVSGSKMPDIEENVYVRVLYSLINNEKDFQKALTLAADVSKKYPDSKYIQNVAQNGFNSVYEMLITKLDNYPEGEELFLNWYKLKTGTQFDPIYENYYSKVAINKYEGGSPDDGLHIIDKAIKLLPKSSVLKNNAIYIAGNQANVYADKKDYENAAKYLKIALTYQADNKNILDNLKVLYIAWIYSEIDAEKYANADKICAEALGRFPDDSKLLYYRKYIDKKIKK
ncbi:MAG: hypothetical protein A2014_01745 [Spirochaetes bacterium GWF1_49_6]|nr:MAG: hypothetical protein A2014_01745 [Spirochaetes bacterium GWF1_49_6]